MTPSEKSSPKPGTGGQLQFQWEEATPAGIRHPAHSPGPHHNGELTNHTPNPQVSSQENVIEAEDSVVADDGHRYEPGHPWHYYREGDNAPPVPFEAIPPRESAGRALADELPKAPAKRIVKVRSMLETEQAELVTTHARYQDVVENGIGALSQYDREIAYGGNVELARAGTLAILYNQISWRRGRIAYLEREQSRGGRTR